jgi:hypothetical protein
MYTYQICDILYIYYIFRNTVNAINNLEFLLAGQKKSLFNKENYYLYSLYI